MDLLSQINTNADSLLSEQEIVKTNLISLSEKVDMSVEQINEAVTMWLVALKNSIEKQTFNKKILEPVGNVLGAIEGLGNPDIADALDEKGNLGSILFNAGEADKNLSNAALKQLKELGAHESLRSFTANARQQLERGIREPQTFATYVEKLKGKIEPIMRNKKAQEEKQVVRNQQKTQQQGQPQRTMSQNVKF